MKKNTKSIEKVVDDQQQVSEKKVVKRTYYFETILILLITAFSVLATFAKQIPYFVLDLKITQLIQQITTPGFRELMIFITTLGNFEWGIFTIIALSIFFVMLQKNINALFLVISVVGAEALSVTFKTLIARPRPDPDLITQLGKHIYSDSFPSGHVLFYIGTYGFLLFLSFAKLRQGLIRNIFIVLFSLLLILIGVSRIYVGAHWFSDTIGAYLIGAAWLLIVIHFYNQLGKKDT